MPTKRKNPVTEAPTPTRIEPPSARQRDPVSLPNPTTGAPSQDNPYSALTEQLPLNLPAGIKLELPDITSLAQGAIGTAENGFAPNPELPRVTDTDREVHAVIYKEQLNAAHNLQDSIKVSTAYVDAAVEGTKLGKSLVKYETGVENIREALFNLEGARTKTQIAGQRLIGLQNELGFLTSENVHRLDNFNAQLDQWRLKVQAQQLKTQELQNTIEVKYAHLTGGG